jgi:hypothetical protein
MRKLLVCVALFLSACDGEGLTWSASDAGVDAETLDTETSEAGTCTWENCTEWGIANAGEMRICLSCEPVACPGPWPCNSL